MNGDSAGAGAAKAELFPFNDTELQAFQDVGRCIAHLGSSWEKDPEIERGFLEAAITANRETLIRHCEGARPSLVGPIKRRDNPEMGVREASCQLRFNLGPRFRFILGIEEQ